MKSKWIDFESPLANGIRAFIIYKRSLGRKYLTEEKNLRLLDRYLVENKITHINDVTPDILDSFLASRPRKRTDDVANAMTRYGDFNLAMGDVDIRTIACDAPMSDM